MTQYVLRQNGTVVPWRILRPLSKAELHSPVEIKKQKEFDNAIQVKLRDSMTPLPLDSNLRAEDTPPLKDLFLMRNMILPFYLRMMTILLMIRMWQYTKHLLWTL
mmetsp:Transcript_12713/g.18115  ORF Transcript_12713/g.18115 Transcript_12713/m.18115 type:complete len:105 (+) Transcript_12713:3282-3596(+)